MFVTERLVIKPLVLTLLLFVLALGCRTVDLVAQARATATPTDRPRPTRTATPELSATPTELVVFEAQVVTAAVTSSRPPTAVPATRRPVVQPTRAPVRAPAPRSTQVAQAAAPPPTPTSQFKYQVAESRCGPNVRTYIEGYVYESGTPKNGVLVRISQGPDGQPDPNEDYSTGSDARRKGYYFHNIDANAPHGGTWYLWVIDPGTQQRISTIAIVKTDPQRVEDSDKSAGSCQSATVTFSNQGSRGVIRTPTRTTTGSRTRTATPTPTQEE